MFGRKRGAPKGNKNAVGNRGGGAPYGNKNAWKHGGYSYSTHPLSRFRLTIKELKVMAKQMTRLRISNEVERSHTLLCETNSNSDKHRKMPYGTQ